MVGAMTLLDKGQVGAFRDSGFLVAPVPGLAGALTQVADEYRVLLDDLAHRLVAEGRISSAFSNLSFEDGLTAIPCARCDHQPRQQAGAGRPQPARPASTRT